MHVFIMQFITQMKLCDPSLIRVIPERIRGEMHMIKRCTRTKKALYNTYSKARCRTAPCVALHRVLVCTLLYTDTQLRT